MGLSNIKTYFNSESPAREDIHLFAVLGSSMSNGYSSNTAQVGIDRLTYFDTGVDVDGILRFDTNSDSNQTGSSSVYKPILLNTDSNRASTAFSNAWYCARDMVFNSIYGTDLIAIFERSHNGTSLLNGETTETWSTLDTGSLLDTAIRELLFYIKYLEGWGYNVILEGINFANHVLSPGGSSTQSDYETEMNAIIAKLRSDFSNWIVSNLPIVWGRMRDDVWTPESIAYRAAVDSISPGNYDYFDLNDHMVASDGVHPRSIAVRDFGRFLSSRFRTLKNGESIPTQGTVTINGTLQVGQAITANYTYNDVDAVSEGETEIQVEYADDISGTNSVTMFYHYKGGTQTLLVTQLGKYIRVGVVPITSTGKVGKIVWSAWDGAVIAA